MILHGLLIFVCLTTTATASWFNRNTLSALADETDHTIAACQEDNLIIQCRNRFNKIVIKSAFYGRDNDFTCTSKIFKANKLCSEPTPPSVNDKVHLMCTGENKCKIPVTSTFLEKNDQEICPDIRKYLKVTYSCHQNPHFHMICQNGCPNSCWPTCQASCCSPPPAVEKMPQSAEPPKMLTISHTAAMISQEPMQCGNGCPAQCAPLCQPTCCQSQAPTLAMAPMTVSVCPDDCSGSCLPLCDPTCCSSKKKQRKPSNLPLPRPLTCPGQCSDACAPSCGLQCCIQQNQCPSSCPNTCAPACNPTCCSHQSMMMMMMPPPQPPPSCPVGCAPQCAPLCQPTCCQSTVAAPPPVYMPPPPPAPTCPQGCPGYCAPMCQPTCCGRVPPQQMMPAPMPMIPQQQPMMMMQPQPPPQAAYMPPAMAPPQMMGGCSPMCSPAMCAPSCSPRCCVSSFEEAVNSRAPIDTVSQGELTARRTYQEMLRNFRQKQIQNYYRRSR